MHCLTSILPSCDPKVEAESKPKRHKPAPTQGSSRPAAPPATPPPQPPVSLPADHQPALSAVKAVYMQLETARAVNIQKETEMEELRKQLQDVGTAHAASVVSEKAKTREVAAAKAELAALRLAYEKAKTGEVAAAKAELAAARLALEKATAAEVAAARTELADVKTQLAEVKEKKKVLQEGSDALRGRLCSANIKTASLEAKISTLEAACMAVRASFDLQFPLTRQHAA